LPDAIESGEWEYIIITSPEAAAVFLPVWDTVKPLSCEAVGQLGQDEPASGRRWSHCSGSIVKTLKERFLY
jgi:hypothetical protein